MNYTIRDAQVQDLEEIIELCSEHAEFEQAMYSRECKATNLASLLFAPDPPAYCLVVEGENGELLGYTAFMREFSFWDAEFYMLMDCLFLRPQARNLGIGEQLIRLIARKAEELDCEQVQWHTPPFNERAIKFYHRIGATSKGKTRLYLNKEMIRELAG